MIVGPDVNVFAYLPDRMHGIIEDLLAHIYAVGEWEDEHEEMLAQWRAGRGDYAMTDWVWWVGYPGCDTYSDQAATREEALEAGKAYIEGGSFAMIEARMWNDRVKDGEDCEPFAEQRNHELVHVPPPSAVIVDQQAQIDDLKARCERFLHALVTIEEFGSAASAAVARGAIKEAKPSE